MKSLSHVQPGPERIAIVCFGFAASRVRRQPWAAANGIAEGFASWGNKVTIVTDDNSAKPAQSYDICTIERLFVRGRPSFELQRTIGEFDPDKVFCFTGAWQLARTRRLDWPSRTWFVMASPRLSCREIMAPGLRLVWSERSVLALPLLNSLLPSALIRAGFRRSGAENLVYLSGETQARYHDAGLPLGTRLRPQVQSFARHQGRSEASLPTVTYLGPPLEMRGAYLALESFETAIKRGARARLQLLMRPDSEPHLMTRFLDRVQSSPQRHLIHVETEMLGPARLNDLVGSTDAFLLPFRAPVSETPLVVLEAGLSGRPVIVLAAPGVSEYAEELGGIVADTPERLPDALMHALRHGLAREAEPGRWQGWREAVRGLLSHGRRPLEEYRFLGLCGVDGSGKTHLLRHLQMELDARNLRHDHVWSRFRNYLSKPLLALARLTGHNRKVTTNGVRVGYHDFQSARWLGWPFLWLQIADNWLDMRLRYRSRKDGIILADRCVLDTLVDLAVDTGLDDWVIETVGPRLLRQLPGPRLIVLIDRPVPLIAQDRPDALADKNFARRRALYDRLAARFQLPRIVNDGLEADAIDQIIALVQGGEAQTWNQENDLRLLQQ